MTWVIYTDAEEKIRAVYENCDTENPPIECVRIEQDAPAEVDASFIVISTEKTLDEKLNALATATGVIF